MDIYLITYLSYFFDIIIHCAINSPGPGKNVVNDINATDKHYIKGQMELLGKFSSNNP